MPVTPYPSSVVYTVLFGGYETLDNEQFVGDRDIPFICFTDEPDLTSDVWEIHVIEPLYPNDLPRSQRDIKIRGCQELDQFDRTLYIDNSVSLTGPASIILDGWLSSHDLAVPAHSFHQTVLDEFLAVLTLGFDDPTTVDEQLAHYAETDRRVLGERPSRNGMIARRNTPEVLGTMSQWFEEVLRYSRRDQLSANVTFARTGIPVNRVAIDNNQSDVHRWPVELGRSATARVVRQDRGSPNLDRVRQLQQEFAEQHAGSPSPVSPRALDGAVR